MTNEELQSVVQEISLQFFQQPFRHQAVFNRRLKTTGGRYHLADHHLDFNPLVYEKYGLEELIAVIKHELCHYHLHLAGKGYQHRDEDFKRLLAETGGSRYAKPLVSATKSYSYRCQKCQTIIRRKRKIDTSRFVCGKCRGRLVLESGV